MAVLFGVFFEGVLLAFVLSLKQQIATSATKITNVPIFDIVKTFFLLELYVGWSK